MTVMSVQHPCEVGKNQLFSGTQSEMTSSKAWRRKCDVLSVSPGTWNDTLSQTGNCRQPAHARKQKHFRLIFISFLLLNCFETPPPWKVFHKHTCASELFLHLCNKKHWSSPSARRHPAQGLSLLLKGGLDTTTVAHVTPATIIS